MKLPWLGVLSSRPVHVCAHVCMCVPVCMPRLLIYGEYCSRMECAQNALNQLLASREDFRLKVEVTSRGPRPEPLGGSSSGPQARSAGSGEGQ